MKSSFFHFICHYRRFERDKYSSKLPSVFRIAWFFSVTIYMIYFHTRINFLIDRYKIYLYTEKTVPFKMDWFWDKTVKFDKLFCKLKECCLINIIIISFLLLLIRTNEHTHKHGWRISSIEALRFVIVICLVYI